MIYKILLLVLITLPVFSEVNSRFSMRRCMLLPISDKVEGAVAFKVFEKVETYLKNSDWCYYKTNSGILNILQNYQPNLERHLTNPEVLRTVANKTKAGSLFHINISSLTQGTDLAMKVYGDNGEDVYFKEKVRLKRYDVDLIARTIINWINVYEKTIPYDGRIVGVLGNQFTVDIGRASKVFIGNDLVVMRPLDKKRHPLLNEVVEWQTENIGKGNIVNVSEFQSSASMKEYQTRLKLEPGDWVIIEKKLKQDVKNKVDYPDLEGYEFGQLGVAGIGAKFASGSDTVNISNTTNRVSGVLYGINGSIEIWATRNMWGSLEVERNIGSYKLKEGSANTSEPGVTQSIFKAKIGYKYLPMGFFYGPQVDIYGGYGKYTYDMDTSTGDGFGKHSFSGILIGAKGNLPFHRLFRGFLKLDLLVSPGYEEDDVEIFGDSANSVTSFQVEFGSSYVYSPQINIDGSFEITSNKAKFNDAGQVAFKEAALKLVGKFSF